MKPQSCKAKGRRLQQQIVADLLDRFPDLTPDDVRSTSMGANGEDILLSSAARERIPFSFEAKNQERLNIWSALQQAEANAPPHAAVAVIIKKNNVKPRVVVDWECFLDLIAPRRADATVACPKAEIGRLAAALQKVAAAME